VKRSVQKHGIWQYRNGYLVSLQSQFFDASLKAHLKLRMGNQESISSTFYARIFCTKLLFCQNVTRKMLRKALLCEKRACKMLMKLTPSPMQVTITTHLCLQFV